MRPDGILTGVAREIRWLEYQRTDNPEVFDLPSTITLEDLSLQLKRMLGIPRVRVVGDLGLPIQRVALSCGSNSWNHQRTLLNEPGVDAGLWGSPRMGRPTNTSGIPPPPDGRAALSSWDTATRKNWECGICEWLRERFPECELISSPPATRSRTRDSPRSTGFQPVTCHSPGRVTQASRL